MTLPREDDDAKDASSAARGCGCCCGCVWGKIPEEEEAIAFRAHDRATSLTAASVGFFPSDPPPPPTTPQRT